MVQILLPLLPPTTNRPSATTTIATRLWLSWSYRVYSFDTTYSSSLGHRSSSLILHQEPHSLPYGLWNWNAHEGHHLRVMVRLTLFPSLWAFVLAYDWRGECEISMRVWLRRGERRKTNENKANILPSKLAVHYPDLLLENRFRATTSS